MVVDRTAEGAVSEDLGPGSLNLLTGNFTLSGADASLLGMSVNRTASSRTPQAGGDQEGQASIFGKEWLSGTAAEAVESNYTEIRKTSATSSMSSPVTDRRRNSPRTLPRPAGSPSPEPKPLR